jgi:hypothetical protein
MSPSTGREREPGGQTVSVRTAGGEVLAYPWATSIRVDRQGNLRVMKGVRQRAFYPCAEWASYTVENLRCVGRGDDPPDPPMA